MWFEREDLHGILDHEGIAGESGQKFRKALDEFDTYVVVNEALIPNYGERWRNEEAIATGFVESAVNQIVSKRFSKKQQMQWTKKGAHLVLQMRTQVLDERLSIVDEGSFVPDRHNDSPAYNFRRGYCDPAAAPSHSSFANTPSLRQEPLMR